MLYWELLYGLMRQIPGLVSIDSLKVNLFHFFNIFNFRIFAVLTF